jgi:flavorubredoxin/flavin reductase (DIM6/NTAB) family NADH-FMN oxidoreductase RutF
MHCTKKITDDIVWVGANHRRLALFEGVYTIPQGVSFNSYLVLDEQTVLFDTVDKVVREQFLENIKHELSGRTLDLLVVQHVEPDHSATIRDILTLYPTACLVCNSKTQTFIKQFYDVDIDSRSQIVNEGDTLTTGKHTFHFVNAPMVHWPEAMVTYDSFAKVLFSADAFGCFGALNGAIFADEVDFSHDYMDEARRYYTNIVGKYGNQVSTLLKKASTLDIQIICPLHGFVWRKNLHQILDKYIAWANYQPEEKGVMIVYASVYGNTENTAEILSTRLRDSGVPTVMYDVSMTPAPSLIAAAFRWSHIVIASTTYNAGIFVYMEAFLHDLIAHNIQNRTIAIIENGTWAATAGNLIRDMFAKSKNIQILDNTLSLKSSLKTEQLSQIDELAETLLQSFPAGKPIETNTLDTNVLLRISYGLYLISAKDSTTDNACIINAVNQITQTPIKISVAINKTNYTYEMIKKTGVFNLSILTQNVPFELIKQFGFCSGRDTQKYANIDFTQRSSNQLLYLTKYSNAYISAKVTEIIDCDTHAVIFAEVTETKQISAETSITYQYYFDHTKPKPPVVNADQKGFLCVICGYIYENDTIPADYLCPLCKHGVTDFVKLGS